MSTDEPGPSHFKNIKARFESASTTPSLNNQNPESTVAKTKRLFEKTKNPINASNRFKPALKPKPKYLSQQRIDPGPPPVPKHASFNHSAVSPVFNSKFNFSDSSYATTSTSNGSSLCPSMSSTLSSSDNLRDSHMSDDALPSTPTATDTPADSSSSEDSSPEFDEDDFYDHERKESINGETSKAETLHTSIINQMKKEGLFKHLEAIKENQNMNGIHEDESNDNNGNDNQGEDSVTYPEYLSTCKIKGSKYGTQFNETVASIVRELEPVLQAHENLLNEFAHLCLSWDSRHPNLAHVLFRNVDFLQICVPFLMRKGNAEFAHATHQFEVQIMNNPAVHATTKFESMVYKPLENTMRNSGVCFYQQLDMVHQNVVRYNLFMERYQKLLNPLCVDEIALTKHVLEKLDKILKSIDSKLEEPQAVAFLLKVYEKFQSLNFNILSPGRHFIKEGLVLRQARKDLVERKLILFSDTLLVCHLDYNKFWKIDLRKMEVEVEDGVEREKWFLLYSIKKSTAIMCTTKTERDNWVHKILQAQNELRLMQRRTEPQEEEVSTFSALWVADDETTMCMMADCARRFSLFQRRHHCLKILQDLFQRRHHCRKCGYVICKACSAFALLPNGSQNSSRVCPVCYYEMLELLHSDTMQWSNIVENVSKKRIKFTNGEEKPIKKLFTPPRTGKKVRGNDYSDKSKYLAAGTVYTKNGTRYARLTIDFNFYIFAARYDPQPAEHFYVQRYSYVATELPKDERVHFKLTQQTGPKNSIIEFE
uniref:Uncharacterized protein n=1 Tax=Panagrolaimus sp. ES5 TaxID=591445 RepID=A0AC34FUB2_9BILA